MGKVPEPDRHARDYFTTAPTTPPATAVAASTFQFLCRREATALRPPTLVPSPKMAVAATAATALIATPLTKAPTFPVGRARLLESVDFTKVL